ncbi:MAG: sulfurtransferase [Acidobacteria bacterium]|nr:sulfurtransferase [Acidobacteriota bacterium]
MRAAALLLALATPALAAAPGRARLVEAAALAIALDGPTAPIVLDARDRRAFEAGRVPGSRNVDWRDFSAVRPGGFAYLFRGSSRWGLLADDAKLAPKLRALGLSASRPVVVVGGAGGWGEEGRIGWMLLALGARDVALLDGGFPAWEKLERARLERGPERGAAPPPGDFEPSPQPGRRIAADALRDLLGSRGAILLDARTPEEFTGKTLTGQARGGRLPGARLVPLAALRAPDGTYASAEALAAAAGPLPAERPVVTYCTGGVRSALLAFLLEARLGVVAANYDGSLWEWSSREDLPMETGAPP